MEPGHYAPPYTAMDRRVERAFDNAYDDFKSQVRTFEGAKKFLHDWVDSENVLATMLMRWSNGDSLKANQDQLERLITVAADHKSEEDL